VKGGGGECRKLRARECTNLDGRKVGKLTCLDAADARSGKFVQRSRAEGRQHLLGEGSELGATQVHHVPCFKSARLRGTQRLELLGGKKWNLSRRESCYFQRGHSIKTCLGDRSKLVAGETLNLVRTERRNLVGREYLHLSGGKRADEICREGGDFIRSQRPDLGGFKGDNLGRIEGVQLAGRHPLDGLVAQRADLKRREGSNL